MNISICLTYGLTENRTTKNKNIYKWGLPHIGDNWWEVGKDKINLFKQTLWKIEIV